MKKTMNRICYFFLALTFFSVGLAIFASDRREEVISAKYTQQTTETIQLPDEDTTLVNSLLSALGGFSGGGLLLIFFIRRLVTSYDDSFTKIDTRLSGATQQQDDKNDKIITMIEDVHDVTHELKVEIIKLQANTADKESVMEALTKVAILETDLNLVKGEVKSIMTHLLNKPRSATLSRG